MIEDIVTTQRPKLETLDEGIFLTTTMIYLTQNGILAWRSSS